MPGKALRCRSMTCTTRRRFDSTELRQLLGGKGAGLVEMRRLGIPVPAGFVLGTPLCRRFLASGWPAELDAAIDAQSCSP